MPIDMRTQVDFQVYFTSFKSRRSDPAKSTKFNFEAVNSELALTDE